MELTNETMMKQHLQYEPYGGGWVDERSDLVHNSGFSSRYRFTGKERDAESSLDYFGARYYWSGGGLWLSVDPLADNYPFLSPYVYGACSPVVLVDADGRQVYVLGDDVSTYIDNLHTKNLCFFVDQNKMLLYEGIPESELEKMLTTIIDDRNIRVYIYTSRINIIPEDLLAMVGLSEKRRTDVGGGFLGNRFTDLSGRRIVESFQFVVPSMLNKEMAQHELIEAYLGGLEALKTGEPLGPAIKGSSICSRGYDKVHKLANRYAKGGPDEDIQIRREVLFEGNPFSNMPLIKHSSKQNSNFYERRKNQLVNPEDVRRKDPRSIPNPNIRRW